MQFCAISYKGYISERSGYSSHMRPLNHSLPHLHQYEYDACQVLEKKHYLIFGNNEVN